MTPGTTQAPVFIEVAINEAVTRAQHRFVPVTPEDCAADAIASVRAGASFAHWHAPSLETYAAAWRCMREADVIAYPSYPNEPPDDLDARLGHAFSLVESDGLEMAPLDLGTAHTIIRGQRRRGRRQEGRGLRDFVPRPQLARMGSLRNAPSLDRQNGSR